MIARRIGALALLACAACSPAQEAGDLYMAQMLACVDRAITIEESRACRAEVRARWGIVDAGADADADAAP